MAQNPKAALLIHYYFPPIHSIGVLRNFYLAQALKKKVAKIKVLTTSNRNVLPQNNMRGLDQFDISELQTKDYRSRRKQTHFKETEKEKWTIKFGRKLIDSYPFNVWIGEGGSSYIRDGIKHGTAFLKENPNAIIYTSFRPYADLYIGSKLKAQFPNTKWIVDFRDLHVDPMYKNVFLPSYQKRVNRKMLKKADLILTVSNGLANELNKTHTNVKTIYNGIVARAPETEKFEKFTISYTGSLFGDNRNPSSFLTFLKNKIDSSEIDLKKIAIKYAGKDGAKFKTYIEKFNLEEIYFDLGMISHTKAKILQQQSHINLLLTSVTKNHKGVLTGKLFEYIGSLTPTVAVITGGTDSEIEKLLEETNSGVTFYEDMLGGNEVLKWYKLWENGKTKINNEKSIQDKYSWGEASNKILSSL